MKNILRSAPILLQPILHTQPYTTPNGSIIRFTFYGKTYTTIEVKSKDSQKEKEYRLEQLNFKKNGSNYTRRSIGYQTRCSSVPNSYLRLSNQPKPKTE